MHSKCRLFMALMIAGVFALLFAAGVEAQIITTIAGGGPNNIPALNAGVFLAYAVAVDAAGNVFITSFNPELQNNQQQHPGNNARTSFHDVSAHGRGFPLPDKSREFSHSFTRWRQK